jgi:peptide/nickel transport system substrate-binding protein
MLAGAPVASAQGQSQVVVAVGNLPPGLLGVVAAATAYIRRVIHDYLVLTDPEGRVIPRLAEKWDRSADGRTYTVHLREAKFHDGRPITADDVKFSFEFNLHPRFPTTAPALYQIEGAQDYKQGRATEVSGITVVDPRTVRFTLKDRYAFFAEGIIGDGRHFIMPRHAWAGVDMTRFQEHPYMRRPIGAGPYRLVEWRERDRMVFEAFADYRAGRPSVERVVLRQIPEPATVMAELRAGNVDVGQVLPDEFEGFRQDQRFEARRLPGDGYYWLTFNHQHPFFRDVRVRQAIYHAIDRETMVRTLFRGLGRVENSPVHPSLWQHHPALKSYPYDPERARQLLREAGFAPGAGGLLHKDGRPFRARFTFPSDKIYQDQALMVQQFARQVGIELTLEPLEAGDFHGRFYHPKNVANIEMVCWAWFNLLLPVQADLEAKFLSTGYNPSRTQYASPEMDALLKQVGTVVEPRAQKAIYHQIQELVLREVPQAMTVRPDVLLVMRRRVAVPEIGSLAAFYQSIGQWKVR